MALNPNDGRVRKVGHNFTQQLQTSRAARAMKTAKALGLSRNRRADRVGRRLESGLDCRAAELSALGYFESNCSGTAQQFRE